MAPRITLIPGDGTAPEITEASVRVLEATGVQFEQGDPAIAQTSELFGQGRVGRISEHAGLPLRIMSKQSYRSCAETRSKQRE